MVNKKPKGLGRGLEALLGPKVEDKPAGEAPSGAPSTLPLDELVPGQYQPRTRMDEGALYELAWWEATGFYTVTRYACTAIATTPDCAVGEGQMCFECADAVQSAIVCDEG